MEIDNQTPLNPNSDFSKQTYGSFGHRLKQERLRQKLSIEDVSSELYILGRHLEAIEAEDYRSLPQIAFTRGFVVNYAKFLGLDADQIVENFNRSYPEDLKLKSVDDIESPLKPMGTLQREGGRSLRINPLLIIGLIGLIVLAIFLIRTVSNAQDANDNTDTNTELVDDLSESEQSAGAAIDSAIVGSGSALDLESSEDATGSDLNNDEAQNLDLTNASDATLDFWIRADTQLNVVDATGKSILSGEQSRGGYKITGKPPFKVQIDPVSNVTLNLNNQPIKLRDFAQNNKADFNLSP